MHAEKNLNYILALSLHCVQSVLWAMRLVAVSHTFLLQASPCDTFDQCASVLQVLEETGFDVGSRLKSNNYIEIHMQEKRSRLYIIQGVCPLMLTRCTLIECLLLSANPLDVMINFLVVRHAVV